MKRSADRRSNDAGKHTILKEIVGFFRIFDKSVSIASNFLLLAFDIFVSFAKVDAGEFSVSPPSETSAQICSTFNFFLIIKRDGTPDAFLLG